MKHSSPALWPDWIDYSAADLGIRDHEMVGGQYGYDRYGNQTSRTTATGSQQMNTDTTTNRLSTGYTYDAGGNVTSGDGYTLSYDALGQAATKTYTATNTFNETYIYTAGEERIGVLTSNSVDTSSWWYWSVRDEGGKVLRQYRSSASDPTQTALWIEDYVYRDGLLVGAERPPTMGGRRHFHLDHLGSPRLITSNDGQIVSLHDYLPFGGETTSVWQEEENGFDREDPMKFTGHERDYAGSFGREDGHSIDYMHARYYSPGVGRFLSVDPLLGSREEPQSWNRYGYVFNNPLGHTDPSGRAPVLIQDGKGFRFAADEDDDGVADEKQAPPPPANPPPSPPASNQTNFGSIKVTAAKGKGAAVTYGQNDNQQFVEVQAPIGYGAGVKLDPSGRLPTPEDGSKPPRAFLGLIASVSVSFGPLSFNFPLRTGVVVFTAPNGKTEIQGQGSWKPKWSVKAKQGLGLGLSGIAGFDVGTTFDFLK